MCDVLFFSNYYIQIARYDKSKKNLIKVKTVALEEGTIVRGEIKNSDNLKKITIEILREEKDLKKVVLVIPECNVSSKSLSLPISLEKEIDEAVSFEAEQFLPYPLSLMVLDYKQLTNGKDNHVLFFAVKKEILDKYIDIFEDLDIEIKAIETPALSMARLVEKETKVLLLIYVDKVEAVLTITRGNEVVATSVLNRSNNFDQVLINTVLRMINFYSEFKIEEIRMGGMGLSEEMMKNLAKFKVPVKIFESIENVSSEVFNNYMLPISAAIADIELPESKKTINLLPSEYVKKYRAKKQNKFWSKVLAWWLVFIILLLGVAGGGYYWFSIQKSKLAKIENSVPQTKKEIITEVNKVNKYAKLVVNLDKLDFFPLKTFKEVTKLSENKGVLVLKVEFSAQDYKMVISGLADSREELLGYKKSLEELKTMVSSVTLPVSSFNEEKNIPFQLFLMINKNIGEVEKGE